SKAYRFYVIELNDFICVNSVIESGDAIFDENRFFSIPRPKDIISRSNGTQGGDLPGETPIEIPEPQRSNRARAGSDREHVDLDVADVSTQPPPKQLDEGFTTTAYPKVQENLKLTVEEYMLLEEPASSSRTLSSLQHLTKDLSFGDLFFSDKPSEADNNKATAET
nr:zinc finger, CCHC-type [Tanacetum cinerariifolium]